MANQSTTVTIKSFEDACKTLGIDPEKVLPDVAAFPEKHRAALLAGAKLMLIAESLNEGWQPDWQNDDEYKWYPWFDMEKSEDNPTGFCLDYVYFGYFADSDVGSRLCFRSRETAKYAGEQFESLYRDYMVI